MSVGLTSYPRTGGGSGGSRIVRIRRLLQMLRGGAAGAALQSALKLLELLESLSRTSLDHGAIVSLANEVRDVLFVARIKGVLSYALYGRAMQVCAEHWVKLYPLSSTGLNAHAERARQMLADAASPAQVRAAKELAGTVALLYRASALLGMDVSVTHLQHALPVEQTRFVQARGERQELTYLQSAACYNINEFIRVDIPGSPLPLIIAGEAKGGSSGYGVAKGPPGILDNAGRSTVRQNEKLYAYTRAIYMANDDKNMPASVARREAGLAIIRAHDSGGLVFLAARGDINGSAFIIEQDVFDPT